MLNGQSIDQCQSLVHAGPADKGILFRDDDGGVEEEEEG